MKRQSTDSISENSTDSDLESTCDKKVLSIYSEKVSQLQNKFFTVKTVNHILNQTHINIRFLSKYKKRLERPPIFFTKFF